ncbi:MAG: helix-hairpin-helix domain-containing protein [Anaerolineales bacterium]|nr:helix-hairpin-helix domain-containing protein [Anaerolineales bacterium]
MTDFLNFLNTAPTDTLTQAPGITRALAEQIIAARPFATVEDCLQVKGMGKALFAKLEAFATAQADESAGRALIPVEAEAIEFPTQTDSPTPEAPESTGPSFWSRLGTAFGNFLRALVRLIFVGALIAGVGALLYYGLPYINQTFIAPVEKNTAQINQLEDEIAALETKLTEADQRLSALETSLETYSASIETLEQAQTALEAQLQENNDKALLEIKQQITLTRVLDMLGRARLYLAQSNFGLAKEDAQNARDLLFALANETNDEVLKQAVARLDLALGNLPQFPVVASGDLEIAWQILVSGEKANAAVTETATLTPEPLPSVTTTPAVETTTATPPPVESPVVTPTP